MLTGRYPFEGAKNPHELRNLVFKKNINFERIKVESARELVRGILEYDPEKRL